jgi:hypothetical protein
MFTYYSYCNYTLYLVQSDNFVLNPFLKRDEIVFLTDVIVVKPQMDKLHVQHIILEKKLGTQEKLYAKISFINSDFLCLCTVF